MGMRSQTNKIIAAGACIFVTAAMFFVTPVALARHPFIIWMDGLIERLEPQYREMIIWDYEAGTTTGALQIPGSLDLRGFEVGDFVPSTGSLRRWRTGGTGRRSVASRPRQETRVNKLKMLAQRSS